MVNSSTKILGLVISAIKNLRETKGSTSCEILNYISAVYNIPQIVARRQLRTALKRGEACGILSKNSGHYSLLIDTNAEYQEIATQELGLLDLYCRRRRRQKRIQKKKSQKKHRIERDSCKCKPRQRRKRQTRSQCFRRRLRRTRTCTCIERKRGRNTSVRPRKAKFTLEPTLDYGDSRSIKRNSNSSMSSIQRKECAIPLPQ